MKTRIHSTPVAIHILLVSAALLLAQGPLTPPGAPAPTMKTLAQIEARTPISSAPFTITQSGSYYLTANINVTSGNAITISAGGVTLDLNGFTISSTEATPAGTGILLGSGVQGIRIFNGHIKGSVAYVAPNYAGPGFLHGIAFSGSNPLNVRVADLTVSGCGLIGINLGSDYSSTGADRCHVRTVGGVGILAGSVNDCVAHLCGGDAIVCFTVANSTGRSTGSGRGIYTNSATNCYGDCLFGTGIDAAFTATGCYGGGGGNGDGVRAGTAQNCYGASSSGAGVRAETAQNCYGVSNSGDGIKATTAQACMGNSNSGSGVVALTAQNCRGETGSGTAIDATFVAIGCIGLATTGTGLRTTVANSCSGFAASPSGTHQIITFKYNMP